MRLAGDDLSGSTGLVAAPAPPSREDDPPPPGGYAGSWLDKRPPVTVGRLRVDLREGRAFVDGVDAGLTWTELVLLDDILRHRGGLRWRHELMREILGYNASATTRALDSHMFRLRHKLGEVGKQIVTVRGLGYRLCLE